VAVEAALRRSRIGTSERLASTRRRTPVADGVEQRVLVEEVVVE